MKKGFITLWLLLLTTSAPLLQGQETTPPLEQALKKVLKRVESLENELKELRAKKGVLPTNPDDRNVQIYLEQAYYGITYSRQSQPEKFLVAKLVGMNLTEEPVALETSHIKLELDGQEFSPTPPSKIKSSTNATFLINQQSYSLHLMKPFEKLNLPSGRAKSGWLIFTKLPLSAKFPQISLKIAAPELKVANKEISLNALGEDYLELQTERLGPHQTLGLLTIHGELNTISIGHLLSTIEKLAEQKTSRFVLCWSETSSKLDPKIYSWLNQQTKLAPGINLNNRNPFPNFPNQVREFHLAAVPTTSSRSRNSNIYNSEFIHKTNREAVEQVLRPAYEVLPRNELVKEIQSGHDLSRVVALKYGGGRLLDEQLPLVLKLADDNNPQIQSAALYCLRKFNSKAAFDKLDEYVRKDIPDLSTVAVDSLSASLFRGAHERLLEILKNQPPESKVEIVKILAANPRPVWSDTIYEFLKDEPDDEYRIEALLALDRIGHPEMLSILEESLAHENQKLQRFAFEILVKRGDSESEKIALEYMLENIEAYPETAPMQELLRRTRDQRAIPLLLAQLDVAGNKRKNIIQALTTVGDESVVPKLLSVYEVLNTAEKAAVLKTLAELQSPELLELAKRELNSSDKSLFHAAMQSLQALKQNEANEVLIEAFLKNDDDRKTRRLVEVLVQMKTREAKQALLQQSLSAPISKRRIAYFGLQQLNRESPAQQYLYNANVAMEEHKYDEAINQCTLALKIDPEYAPAYSVKGNAHFKLEQYEEARSAFEKTLKFDPYDMMSVTGNSILMVREGKPDDAFKHVEKHRTQFQQLIAATPQRDRTRKLGFYAYNVACVYGVALGVLREENKEKLSEEELQKKINSYEKKAIQELQSSVKNGFDDLEWMRKDPDLISLHQNEEFRKISGWPQDDSQPEEQKPQEQKTEEQKPDQQK